MTRKDEGKVTSHPTEPNGFFAYNKVDSPGTVGVVLGVTGNSETLGCMLTFIGLMIYEGATLTSLKIAFVFLLVFMANPIGSHILSKSAYKSGHPIWTLKTKGAKKLLGLAGPDHSIDEPVGHLEKEEK